MKWTPGEIFFYVAIAFCTVAASLSLTHAVAYIATKAVQAAGGLCP